MSNFSSAQNAVWKGKQSPEVEFDYETTDLTQLSSTELLLYIQEQDRKLEQKTDEANRAWDIVQSQALELDKLVGDDNDRGGLMRDIPTTYAELKQEFIGECKQRYEDNEQSIEIIREAAAEKNNFIDEYNGLGLGEATFLDDIMSSIEDLLGERDCLGGMLTEVEQETGITFDEDGDIVRAAVEAEPVQEVVVQAEVQETPAGFLPADIVWEVLGESELEVELNRRLFPENFTDDETEEEVEAEEQVCIHCGGECPTADNYVYWDNSGWEWCCDGCCQAIHNGTLN